MLQAKDFGVGMPGLEFVLWMGIEPFNVTRTAGIYFKAKKTLPMNTKEEFLFFYSNPFFLFFVF